MTQEASPQSKRAIVAAVQLSNVSDLEFESSLAELRQLAKTLGLEVAATFTQKRAGFDKAAYFGTGKREELKEKILESGAELLLIDHEISPSQAFNLGKEVGCEVMDRAMVILEIFHRHARSRIARAQVEIARLGYMAPRLREAAKQAGPKDRARSGTGGRSGGESHGELDRRKIRDRIAELQKELDAMDLGRKTQRARRQERQGLARVALVGYTNAGKSTLMRALTGSATDSCTDADLPIKVALKSKGTGKCAESGAKCSSDLQCVETVRKGLRRRNEDNCRFDADLPHFSREGDDERFRTANAAVPED